MSSFINNSGNNANNNNASLYTHSTGSAGSFYQQQQQQQQQQPPISRSNTTAQLWMGELDPWWDENSIRSIWATFGYNNVSIKLIKEKIQQGYNAGYCFVEFPSLELASNALSQNGTKIPNTNKVLKLNWASGGNGHVGSNRSNEISIFVGDLAPEITEAMLYELFGTKYSSISGTKIMIDQVTGISKGYGFVRFLNEADQQRALTEMQGAILNGRPIRVSTAVPKNRQQQQQQQPLGLQQQQLFGQRQGYQQQSPGIAQQQQILAANPQSQQILTSFDSQYQPPLNQFTDPNNTTVFIGGLSSIVTEDELRLYFQPFGDITYVKIPIGKGCGFVQYTTRASAELAISKMQGYPIGNSRIRLSWGRSNSNPKPQQYKPQQELPLLYGYQNQNQQPLQYAQTGLGSLNSANALGSVSVPNIGGGSFGVQQIQQSNSFSNESSDPVDQSRLNELYLAARDGRLDTIDSGSNGFIFA